MNEYNIISGILFLVGIVLFVISWILPKQLEKIQSDETRTYKPNRYKQPLLITGSILMGIGLAVFLLSIRQKQVMSKNDPSSFGLKSLPDTPSAMDTVKPFRNPTNS